MDKEFITIMVLSIIGFAIFIFITSYLFKDAIIGKDKDKKEEEGDNESFKAPW